MSEIVNYMTGGIMIIGYLYILVRAWKWLFALIFSAYDRSRKEERKQKAINELYDAFKLDQLQDNQTVRVATKSGLVIMMYRQENNGG
ncbi:DUF4752 family protein [Xenorhabdus griffiniae]|uniref:DUF4752 family protein n=1 Tax=Xenorhabdus griffiniae TaxID=351672 RepID=UPI0030D04D12